MKNIVFKNIPKDAIYKDVVIIGNGPSGISLSFMLSGNWPYWNSEKIQKHPDELLRARLNYLDNKKSLIEQDLKSLTDGLEGRSTNTISLLYDSLEHPCADLGLELPSMLEYKHHSNKKIEHVVLGKGPPGGSWHKMDPNLRTLSLAGWMSLPGLNYNEWEIHYLKEESEKYGTKIKSNFNNFHNKTFVKNLINTNCESCEIKSKDLKNCDDNDNKNNNMVMNNNKFEKGPVCCKCTKRTNAIENLELKTTKDETLTTKNKNQNILKMITPQSKESPPRRNLSLKRQLSKEEQTRALVSRVAKYYEDYVRLMNLEQNFMNNVLVTLLGPIQEDCIAKEQDKFRSSRWLVCGINQLTGRPIYFACANVVLANGASDLANRLGLYGENINTSWVKHELPQLESELELLKENERKNLKPVLVVGAGLSAADAVTICRSSDIHVIHVFRSRTAGLDKMLPENIYPEYHEVHHMMKDLTNKYDYYTPIPEHTISDLSTQPDGAHIITVKHINTGEEKSFEVSFCAILIGSKPDLRFISGIKNKSSLNHPKSISITSCLVSEKPSLDTVSNSILLGKKLSWLKTLCAKCKHLNFCNRNRYTCDNDINKLLKEDKICLNQIVTNVTNNKTPTDNENEFIFQSINTDNGIGLGIDQTKPIDCKTNQIAVDKFTNEVIYGGKGLYAMGPLVGDNFVRFIPGGALAITAALHNLEND